MPSSHASSHARHACPLFAVAPSAYASASSPKYPRLHAQLARETRLISCLISELAGHANGDVAPVASVYVSGPATRHLYVAASFWYMPRGHGWHSSV